MQFGGFANGFQFAASSPCRFICFDEPSFVPPVFIALRTAPISAVVAISLILNSFAFAESSPDKLSSEAAFKTATELMGKGEFKRAIPYLSRVQRELPDDGSVLWNLGLAFAATGEHSKAVETWQSYRRIEPDDWAARAKLVQAYQALGDVKARDDEIKSLYEFRNNSSDPKVNTAERFCREQGVIANRSVFVFEYFAPPGPRPQYLRFCILNKKGEVDYYLSLGSYDDTTAIARELGELKEDERLYHLDEYTDTGHRTFAFFKTRPEYEEVRSAVVRALGGKSKPISGSSISK